MELEGLEERIVPNIQVNTNSDAPNLPPQLITLRRAINDAGGGVTITFAPNLAGQTIQLTSALTISKNITINNNSGGVINVQGSGVNLQNTYNDFIIASGFTCGIYGLTISNGCAQNGGGVFNSGTLTLSNDSISANTANNGSGGGIFNKGTLILSEDKIGQNGATNNGGGVCNSGGKVTISGGTASWINNNQANRGAGIYSVGGQLAIYDTQIEYNTAQSNGGGVYISGTSVSTIGSMIANNYGANGGGLYEAKGNVNLTSCSINTNTAKTGSGGGLYLSAGALSISGGTITGNNAMNGNGGGIADFAGTVGSLTLKGGVAFKSNSVGNAVKTSGGNNKAVIAGAGGGLYVVKGSVVSFNGCSFTNDKAAAGSGVAVENLPQNIFGWDTVTDNDDPPPDYVSVN